MSLNRRQFIKLAGLGMGGMLVAPQAVVASESSAENEVALLYDPTKCIGCRACQNACREWNGNLAEPDPDGLYDAPTELSADTWTLITLANAQGNWSFFNYQCMHCTDAACVMVCPTGALHKDKRGFVAIDQEKCNGCGYCTQFCPYGVPHLGDVNLVTGEAKAAKCTFCQDRIQAGIGGPFCAERCPTRSLIWGNRGDLLKQAKTRVSDLKDQGFDGAMLYGERETGGLHRLSIMLDEPSVYGMPTDPQAPFAFSTVWQKVIQPMGLVAVGASALGLVITWLVARANIKLGEA
jgi:formate dehydrogenase iron-sulfur subunit